MTRDYAASSRQSKFKVQIANSGSADTNLSA
jgi:hypothetical protein